MIGCVHVWGGHGGAQKGEVVSTEARAFANSFGIFRSPSKDHPLGVNTSLTGFGPNINILRSPSFGRNSEMVGEDPILSGSYAYEMVSAQQTRDAAGHPRMLVYLKHYTAVRACDVCMYIHAVWPGR